jgi:hypothetical protein
MTVGLLASVQELLELASTPRVAGEVVRRHHPVALVEEEGAPLRGQ